MLGISAESAQAREEVAEHDAEQGEHQRGGPNDHDRHLFRTPAVRIRHQSSQARIATVRAMLMIISISRIAMARGVFVARALHQVSSSMAARTFSGEAPAASRASRVAG